MLKLTPHMKEVLKQQPVAFVATSDAQGWPNVSPKGIVRATDDGKLIFADLCSLKTRSNLRVNTTAAVAVVIPHTQEGYQFKGTVELIDKGPLFEEMADLLARCAEGPRFMELPFEKVARETMTALAPAGSPAPRPTYAVVLHVEEVWNLTPGHETEVWR